MPLLNVSTKRTVCRDVERVVAFLRDADQSDMRLILLLMRHDQLAY